MKKYLLMMAVAALLIPAACKEQAKDEAAQSAPTEAVVVENTVVDNAAAQTPPVVMLPTEPLQIKTAAGGTHDFTVEMATHPRQQARGLMFRESMPEDHGMLFVFNDVAPRSFWMRNTLIPLDMVFIAEDGTVINIEANTVPHDETSRKSTAPAKAVLELNGGMAAKLNIVPGDVVHHGVFNNVSAP